MGATVSEGGSATSAAAATAEGGATVVPLSVRGAQPHPLQQQQRREVQLWAPLPWLSAQWREVPLCEQLPWLTVQTLTQRGVSF